MNWGPYLLLPVLAVCSHVLGNGAACQVHDSSSFVVAGYWTGGGDAIGRYSISALTHINFSFIQLQEGRVALRDERDSLTLRRLDSLKAKFPRLKIVASFGGWGGCENCSGAFSSPEGRERFAQSTKEFLDKFNLDGIDLDWEYPAIEGYPNHAFAPEDRHNFTLLLQELRQVLGTQREITFAAGGFEKYLSESIEWARVVPLVDRVYLMTYDFVNGSSTETGHHTLLYSTVHQKESTDNAVRFLDSLGVPRRIVVIGAAFYARVWGDVRDSLHGVYQQGRFADYVSFRELDHFCSQHPGFESYWDSTASAPYRYNPREKLFMTFDNRRSVSLKTRYALDKGLGGIMFWELSNDLEKGGLLDAIDSTRNVLRTPLR